MSLMTLIGALLIAGLILYVISQLPFIDAGIKKIIYLVVVVVIALWLIQALFGTSLGSLRVG